MTIQHLYEVRPRKDGRGFDLISDALPFGRLWYDGPNAITNVTVLIRRIDDFRVVQNLSVAERDVVAGPNRITRTWLFG